MYVEKNHLDFETSKNLLNATQHQNNNKTPYLFFRRKREKNDVCTQFIEILTLCGHEYVCSGGDRAAITEYYSFIAA